MTNCPASMEGQLADYFVDGHFRPSAVLRLYSHPREHRKIQPQQIHTRVFPQAAAPQHPAA